MEQEKKMTDKYLRDRLGENESPSDNSQTFIDNYRTSSFFELYNNQHCIKNDLTRKQRTIDNSFNRSEDDEECNLNDIDDLNFDDDMDKETLVNEGDELSSSEEDEQEDKFDEEENNENDGKLGIPINQRFRKHRSNSRTIHENEIGSSFKQYARSLPVNIPNFKKFAMNNRKAKNEENLDWFSVKDNPESIAESIKALAKSVHVCDDEYELFGDLPRRFNTSEIINGRPI